MKKSIKVSIVGAVLFVGGLLIFINHNNLPAPEQISPNYEKFDNIPRTITFEWSKVPGAVTYAVEIDMFFPDIKKWGIYERHENIFLTKFTLKNFSGAQPGRWRVYAVNRFMLRGRKSDWRKFVFLR